MYDGDLFFLNDVPKGVYKYKFWHPMLRNCLSLDEKSNIKERLNNLNQDPTQKFYIKSTDEFFQRWINGYLKEEPRLGCKGFQLEIPKIIILDKGNVYENDFQISKVLGGLTIATDLAYSTKRNGFLVFVINEMIKRQVLSYAIPTEDFVKSPLKKKVLIDKKIIGGYKGLRTYPFGGIHLENTVGCTWTAIGISPEEIYDALRRINFVWS